MSLIKYCWQFKNGDTFKYNFMMGVYRLFEILLDSAGLFFCKRLPKVSDLFYIYASYFTGKKYDLMFEVHGANSGKGW